MGQHNIPPECSISVSLNGTVTSITQPACDLLGINPDAVLHKPFNDLLLTCVDVSFSGDELLGLLAESQNPGNFSGFKFRDSSGSEFQVSSESRLNLNDNGQVNGAILVFSAVGQPQDHAAAAFDFLVEAKIGTWSWNVNSGKLEINSFLAQLLGLQPDEIPNLTIDVWQKRCHPDDIAHAHALVHETVTGQRDRYETEIRIRSASGEWIPVIDRGFVSRRDRFGAVEEMSGVYFDITQHSQRNSQSADRQSTYRDLFENNNAIKLLIDSETGEIVDANSAASTFYGYDKESLQQLHIWDLNMLGRQRTLECMRLAAQQDATSFEFTHRCANGETREVQVYTGRVVTNDSILLHSIVFDISDRKLEENRLQRLQQLESLGVLASGIAHDFNNVLTGIFGNLSVARLAMEKDHPAAPYLEMAENSIRQASGLSNQLFSFAQTGIFNRSSTGIGNALREDVLFNLVGSNVQPEFEIPHDLWPIHADSVQLQQVFSNLTLNANQAMPQGGQIFVSAHNTNLNNDPFLPNGRYVEIRFRDTGCGMTPDQTSRIFEPWYTTRDEGRGLGLATCQSVIHEHAGRIHVESAPGEGATFTIYLPASDTDAVESQDQSEEMSVPKRGRVLILDDDEMILKTVRALFAKINFETRLCTTGDEVLAAYVEAQKTHDPFDMVILDLTLPGGPGGQNVAKQILQIDSDARLVCSSGYVANEVMSDPAANGFRAALPKPYLFADLKQVVRTVCRELFVPAE